MSNLILPVKIAPITPELLERFKASGEWIWTSDFVKAQYSSDFGGWHDAQGYRLKNQNPTHYLPDGLPDPSAAVEVFETQIERFYLSGNNDYELGIGYPSEVIPPEGTKVGVFKL
jgi:hypothetical protein